MRAGCSRYYLSEFCRMAVKPHIDVLDLPCRRLPAAFDGLTLLHLSDLHVTKWTKSLDAWREALGDLKPQLVVITGDLGHRSWLWESSLKNVQRLLEPLTPALGTFFILGNHDSAKLGPALAQYGRLRGNGADAVEESDGVYSSRAGGVCGGSEIGG